MTSPTPQTDASLIQKSKRWPQKMTLLEIRALGALAESRGQKPRGKPKGSSFVVDFMGGKAKITVEPEEWP